MHLGSSSRGPALAIGSDVAICRQRILCVGLGGSQHNAITGLSGYVTVYRDKLEVGRITRPLQRERSTSEEH